MANAIYPKWKEALLQNSANSALTGTVKVALIDTGAYTYSAAHLLNEYPDPSQVLAGVVYGPGLVGTLIGGYDGSLKLDVATGRMVKPISNKVVLSL